MTSDDRDLVDFFTIKRTSPASLIYIVFDFAVELFIRYQYKNININIQQLVSKRSTVAQISQ